MPNQKPIQPFQIEELKFSAGFLRGYPPSVEAVANTVVVRDEEKKSKVHTLIVEDKVLGNVEGELTGNVTGDVTGNVTGDVIGNLIGNVDGDSIKAKTLNVSEFANIKKMTGSVEGLFTGTSQGKHFGEFDGVYKGVLNGSVHGDVEGNLVGNTLGTHIGPVVGNIEGEFVGKVIGNLIGNVEGNVKGDVEGSLFGNANTATKLQTPRNIDLVGVVKGSAVFDGTSDLTINTVFGQELDFDINDLKFKKRLVFTTPAGKISYVNGTSDLDFATITTVDSKTKLNLTDNVIKEGKEIYREDGQIIKVSDGGTGVRTLSGILKGNGSGPILSAEEGTDYLTADSTNTLTHKIIDLADSSNRIKNISVESFDPSALTKVFPESGTGSDLKIPTEKAVKAFVEATYTGLSWKRSVVAATTENKDLNTDFANGLVIDTVELKTGDRILVKNQSIKAENGIYIVLDSGKPVRSEDANSPIELYGSAVFVINGHKNKNTGWVCNTPIRNMEVDPVEFNQFSGTSMYVNGTGIDIIGNTINVDSTVVDLNSTQTLTNKTIYGSFVGNISGESTSCSGSAQSANTATTAKNVAGGGTVSAVSGVFTDKVVWKNGDSNEANIAYAERLGWSGEDTGLNPDLGRRSLGLGSLAIQNADSVNIKGGKIEGIVPLAVEYGGTGARLDITGLIKGNGAGQPLAPAVLGVDYVSADSTGVLKNKTISGKDNTIKDLSATVFKDNVLDTSGTLDSNSDERIPTQKAVKTYVDRQLTGIFWKEPVRCATVSSLSILEDVKAGKVIDGVVLRELDRVLIKDQVLESENGVYEVKKDIAPERVNDLSTANNFRNAAVIVLEGAINNGTSWLCISKDIVEWSSPIIWRMYGIKNVTVGSGLKFDRNAIVPDESILVYRTKNQDILEKRLDSNTVKFSNLSSIEGSLEFALNNSGTARLVVSGTGNKTYTMPSVTSTLYASGAQTIPVSDGGTGLSAIPVKSILYASDNNVLTTLSISDKIKALLGTEDLKTELREELEIKNIVDYNVDDLTRLYNTKFIRVEGINSFLNPVSGVSPISGDHLATKSYVDSILTGVKYLTTVKSEDYNNNTAIPNNNVGDSYLVGKNPSGEWAGHENEIATLSKFDNNVQTWVFTTAQSGEVVYIADKGLSKQWKGDKWIVIGSPRITSHDSLTDIKGGNYHLTIQQYNDLFNSEEAVRSHRHNHNDGLNIQGGSVNQRWHLSTEQYKDLTGQTEKSVTHTHDHNMLINSQGGKLGEKYHLTLTEHTSLTTGTTNTLHGHPHSVITDLRGGGDYHLSSIQYDSLVKGNVTNLHKHNHNTGIDIQGGIDGERYHLSRDQHNQLINNGSTTLHTHDHDNLVGIKGGKIGERYHIDFDTYEKIKTGKFGVYDHNELTNQQGGKSEEHYHLTLTKYQQLENFTGIIGDHNSQNNLQGGSDTERYHLTRDQHNRISNFVQDGISHNKIKSILGDGEYHLSQVQFEELTKNRNTNLHIHDIYSKIDGSKSFTSPVSGIDPVDSAHLATKRYVDLLASGIKWVPKVKSMTILNPDDISSPTKGDRYIIDGTPVGSWTGHPKSIAEYNGTSWDFITYSNNTAAFVEDKNSAFVYMNSIWCQFTGSISSHADLIGVNGGDWHLTNQQHDSLVSGQSTDLHYHISDRDLNNAIGILNVNNGGIGLRSVSANRILYTTGQDQFSETKISELGRRVIAAESFSDLTGVLPYGTMANQDSHNVSITGGSITGIAPLAAEYGGTGSTGIVGIVKGNGKNPFTTAEAGVDYLTPNCTCVLRNKSIDARSNGNSIKNLDATDFIPGFISTDPEFSSANDNRLVSQLAIKTYVDTKVPGGDKGIHEFTSPTHRFTGAVENSIVVFTGVADNPAQYKTLEASPGIKVEQLDSSIRFSLEDSVALLDKNQTLKNKILDTVTVLPGTWQKANHDHTSVDTGGQLTENALKAPISPLKGGTGLASIEKGHIPYAIASNKYGSLKLGSFFKNIAGSNDFADFMSKVGNRIAGLKQLEFQKFDSDPTYIPNITSLNDFEIAVSDALNISASNINIDSEIASGKISAIAQNYDIKAGNSIDFSTRNIKIDFSESTYPTRGLYIKDKIDTEYTENSSTVAIGGTLAIVPSTIKFTPDKKQIELDAAIVNHTSVILLSGSTDLPNNYATKDLELVLEDPEKVKGQYLYIKLIIDSVVTITSRGNNKTIDGDQAIKLTQKYMAVTLYSSGTDWLIL